MSCWLADLLIGPPTAFPLLGTGVLVSLRNPLLHWCDFLSRQNDGSPKQPHSVALHWGSAALHWAEVELHWLHSWRVHLQHYQTWPTLCNHFTTQENQAKLWRDLTWLSWLENSIDLDNFEQSLRVHLSHWMCNQFTHHYKVRIDGWRTKFKQGKRDSILFRVTKIHTSLTWPNHVLHGKSRKRGKDTRIRWKGSTYSLLNENDWSSIKQDVTESSFTKHAQLVASRKLLWWNLEESSAKKYMHHLNHHRRFPEKMIGWKNWIQKSLEAAKTPNESNPNQKPNYQKRGDQWVDKNQKMSCLVMRTSSTQQERWDPCVDQNPSKVACRCLSKIEEFDNDFRVPGLSPCNCERSITFPSSRVREKDLQSSSLRRTSSRCAAEGRLQPIQQHFEGDDSWIGLRVVRNYGKSATIVHCICG